MKTWTADELLSDEFVERLWSHLPLHVYCDCEEEWDDEAEAYGIDEDACQCKRKTILPVRNCLAAALGEPQVSATAPSSTSGPSDA